eukprot:4487437-Pyramimonas_sp.AAC.1
MPVWGCHTGRRVPARGRPRGRGPPCPPKNASEVNRGGGPREGGPRGGDRSRNRFETPKPRTKGRVGSCRRRVRASAPTNRKGGVGARVCSLVPCNWGTNTFRLRCAESDLNSGGIQVSQGQSIGKGVRMACKPTDRPANWPPGLPTNRARQSARTIITSAGGR